MVFPEKQQEFALCDQSEPIQNSK